MSSTTSTGTGGSGSTPPPSTLPTSTVIKLSRWMSEKFYLLSKVSKAKNRKVKRGNVYWCEFGENVGSEQCLKRPAVILQNDNANFSSPNVVVAPITNTADKNSSVYPLARPTGSPLQGHVLLGNIVTVSKARLGDYIDRLDAKTEMPGVEKALYNALGVGQQIEKTEKQLERTSKYLEEVKKTRNDAQDSLKAIREALALPKEADTATIMTEIVKLKIKNPDDLVG